MYFQKLPTITCQSNIRNDEYSVAPENVTRMLSEIVEAIRQVVPTTFIIGIKINSADYVISGSTEEASLDGERRVLDHIRTIASWGMVDFIEISGGDYEKPGKGAYKENIPHSLTRSPTQTLWHAVNPKQQTDRLSLRGFHGQS